MTGFKDIIASDIHSTFINTEEFSDLHIVNGEQIPVQVDENEQIEREKRLNQNMEGLFTNQKLIYVAASDYGPLPKQGSMIIFDGKRYTVVDAINEGGVYSITMEANRA